MARRSPPRYLDAYKEQLVEETAEFIHDYDMAHVVMLGETGILPSATALSLLDGLVEMRRQGGKAARSSAGGGNHAGERYLTRALGPTVGGAIGLARSSGDLSAMSFRMWGRDRANRLRLHLLTLRAALVDFAEVHRDSVLPGNTHGQHAQPITFALWAMMYHDALGRDSRRLGEFHRRANTCPAGAGIMSGTEFPINRARIAELLGFDGAMPNTLDAALSHDLELEYVSALCLLCYTLSRLAEDLFLWATSEYRLLRLPDWFIGHSSMMPQKRNPDGLQDLRNLGAQAQAAWLLAQATERGPTGFPIIERRNSDRELRRLTAGLIERLDVLPELFPEMQVDTERAELLANSNWASVTDLAGAVVRLNGTDWRTAHGLVAEFVNDCTAKGMDPARATADDFNAVASRADAHSVILNDAVFARALDARAFISRRETFGGPGPLAMAARCSAARADLAAETAEVEGLDARLGSARGHLEAVVAGILRCRKFQ